MKGGRRTYPLMASVSPSKLGSGGTRKAYSMSLEDLLSPNHETREGLK